MHAGGRGRCCTRVSFSFNDTVRRYSAEGVCFQDFVASRADDCRSTGNRVAPVTLKTSGDRTASRQCLLAPLEVDGVVKRRPRKSVDARPPSVR
jgi:hypothetical protein